MKKTRRMHLTKDEVESILTVARKDSKRNWCALVLALNHGCRVSELAGGRKESYKTVNGVTKHIPAMLPLQLTDIDFKNKQNTIRRLKGSRDTTQPFINHRGKPLLSDESAIREYLAERIDDGSGLLFTGQKGPLSRWTLDEMFKKYCREASAQRVEKGFPAIPEEAMHFHTIRHTTGTFISSTPDATVFKTAAWLGHANVQNAQIYWHPDSRAIGSYVQQSMVRTFAGL
jgi:integrase